ncbi:MAG TPA: transglycosylase domain-containing protein [Oceanobacillus sp.]|nr:transglycosylase domain-containing protein [Oceanobacillus sp.]
MPDEHELPEDSNQPSSDESTPVSENTPPDPAYQTADSPAAQYEKDETEPLEIIDSNLELSSEDDEIDLHEMPTVPFPPEEVEDPRRTLHGSGGFDPNPDFTPPPEPPPAAPQHDVDSGYTVPHIVPFQHTLVHVPGESREVKPAPQRPTKPHIVTQGPTVQQPAQQYHQYQQTTQPSVQQPMYPAPPQAMPPGQGLPRRRAARPRRILGCSPGCVMVFVGLIATFCGGLTLVTLILTATLGAQLEERLQAQIARVDDYDNFESTFYYDRNGTLLYESFTEGRRVNVPYEDFPQDLINATIAIEDDSFWNNPGFEVQATLRAFLQYVGLAEGSTGGSTITQQVVRNVLFEPEYRAERSVQRKVEEILLAFLLRQRKSPQEVLELYLNESYYGNLAYGAQAAALTFFNKNVQDLTLAESALLAGLPQAPAILDPFNQDPAIQEMVIARWTQVLNRMVEERLITREQRDQALREGYSLVPPEAPLRAPHFTVYAQQQLEALMTELGYSPEDVARGGLRVYTTVDLQINDMAQRIAREQIAGLSGANVSNAAVVVMQPVTGEIFGMVGSVDYNNDAIDGRVNVAISPRQPGSTMKPFMYAAAFELGMTPGDIIWDTPTDIAGYVPQNYDRTFRGPVQVRQALAQSLNIPAVQTLRWVGVENLLAIMRRFGVESLGDDPSQYGLSLTLGGGEITLLELTRGYSVFANGGAYVPSTAIRCILASDDTIIYEYNDGCPRGVETERTVFRAGFGTDVLDPRIAFLISDILGDEEARRPVMGPQSDLWTGNILSSVKTGTTDNFRDNWTVGYTRNLAVGVWVGNSRGEPMTGTTGLTGAAPIWNDVITGIYNDQNLLSKFAIDGQLLPDRLDQPGGMSLRNICLISALREPALDCPATRAEWFLDSPAGQFNGVDGLNYPPATPPPADQPPASGPWLREVEPDIYRVLVQPISPEIAQAIQFGVEPGQPQPPPPLYCQVPVELVGSAPTAQEQLFIAPPPDPADAVRAEQFARNNGIPFLPTIACSPELISAGSGPVIVTAFITSPANGQVFSSTEPIQIIGTAQFSPQQAQYYRVDIIGGPFPEWRTIGNIHSESVVNGVLESLPPLSPADYQLQLIVVGNDGNYVQPPFQVSFSVQ